METKDYEIKVEGDFNQFEGGAIRYNKNKGRMDLIPEQPVSLVFEYAKNHEKNVITSDTIMMKAFDGDYVGAIVDLIYYNDSNCANEKFALDKFHMRFYNALLELSIHFQKGAEKYGERNCEKGIPLSSFRDSGIRHLCMYLKGETDENHYIAAVWNFWMAVWTVNKNK